MKHRRLLCILSLVIVLACLSCPTTEAAVPFDRDMPSTLSISYVQESHPIVGTQFDVYKVAELSDDYNLSFVEPFADLIIDSEDMTEVALQLYYQILDNTPKATASVVTDGEGRAHVDGLLPGAYLLVGNPVTINDAIYYTDPQLLVMPQYDDASGWCYELTVYPKSTDVPVTVEPIDITVQKIWADEGFENLRPKAITVRLLREGKSVDSVILSEKNGWSHTWDGLVPNAKWTVEEAVPEGYVVEITKSGNVFQLTNYRKNIDQTGTIWWPTAVLFVSGLLLLVIGICLRRRNRSEAT